MLESYEVVRSEEHLKEIINGYNESALVEYVAIDSETTGVDRVSDVLLSISITASDSGKAYFVDRAHVKPLASLTKPVVLHNFKFDFHMLAPAGVPSGSLHLLGDTLLLDHLLDENNPHGLDDIIQRRYKDNYKAEFWAKYKEYHEAPFDDQVAYACKDVLYTDRVYRDTLKDLATAQIPKSLIEHVHRLALVLFDTEANGIKVDLPYVSTVGAQLSNKITQLLSDMREVVPYDIEIVENNLYERELDKRKTPKGKLGVVRPSFSFDSTQQLGMLLYDTIKLPEQLSKQRKRTVDDDALAKLNHPVIIKLREYRGHQKTFGSFIEGTLDRVRNGRIYPSFNVNGTVTGRLSSSNPNLQQLPNTGGVRGIYIPKDEDHRFISCDYSQLEVVIAAHFSSDPALLAVINEGASLHDITAKGLSIPRQVAKGVNFALQYGAGVSKLKHLLGCSEPEAELAYKKYWETYPGLAKFNAECHLRVDRGLPMVNPFGRRRRFPTQFASHWDRERAKRQAPNALIQGTGSDCTSMAVYLVNGALLAKGFGKVMFSIHDEVLIEVHKNYIDESAKILHDTMVGIGNIINLRVPLKAQVSEGMTRWLD